MDCDFISHASIMVSGGVERGVWSYLCLFALKKDPANLIDGVKFNEALLNMEKIELENDLIINYIGLNDLIKNKQVSGRRQDLTDVKTLQKLIKSKKASP